MPVTYRPPASAERAEQQICLIFIASIADCMAIRDADVSFS
jgi:hypothetical protein